MMIFLIPCRSGRGFAITPHKHWPTLSHFFELPPMKGDMRYAQQCHIP